MLNDNGGGIGAPAGKLAQKCRRVGAAGISPGNFSEGD
jgi:hypothetical protein